MRHISIDIETYSDRDIKECGHFCYIDSPAFEIMLIAYSYTGSDKVNVVSLIEGETLPDAFISDLFDPNTVKHAYNASFEWYALSKHFKLSEEKRNEWLSQWQCTMIHGAYLSYPTSLKDCGTALNLPQDKSKDKQGAALIKLFCCPQKPTQINGHRSRIFPHHEPDKWRMFKEYNAQDVTAEKAIEERFADFPVPDEVFGDWRLNETIVSRGVHIDRELVDRAGEIAEGERAILSNQMALLTGLQKTTDQPLCQWLTEQLGFEVTSVKKECLEELLQRKDLPPNVEKVLKLRSQKGKTSLKKFDAMKKSICADGTVKGTLRYYGARTGRWSGDLIQPQNIPRVYIEDIDRAVELVKSGRKEELAKAYGSNTLDTLSQLIRPCIIAPEGSMLVDADFSAIEARVISWLANERWRLDVFRSHGKIYEASASQMFGVPIEKIKKGNPEYALRAKGKIAELALGYQGGVGALINMGADKMNLSQTELQDIVDRWRSANKAIAALWTEFNSAAVQVVQKGAPIGSHNIIFRRIRKSGLDFLTVTLPGGRTLYYAQPKVVPGRFGPQIEFMGYDKKRWIPLTTYGGKLTENIVQAIARDILAEKIRTLECSGVRIILHVHDEVVTEWPRELMEAAKKRGKTALEIVCSIMKEPVSWAPDIPLNAEGYISPYFKKD
ncbi:MAG: DNA polymerase [Ruminococcus sp.]|nr:DNA polymerase [Ruminococcus sp.]